jgi:hypothetical protein
MRPWIWIVIALVVIYAIWHMNSGKTVYGFKFPITPLQYVNRGQGYPGA